MKYKCEHCDWEGTWDEMILETLCPLCRSSVKPVADSESTSQGTRQANSYVPMGAPPQ